jgi:single-strand DNA-binding protein
MIIVGRITKDAVVQHLQDDRKVVGFSIAINDYYKPKGQEKGVQLATFLNCSYWVSAAIADRLKKGILVELSGRIGLRVYNDMNGEAKGSLTFHTNSIKIHQAAKEKETEHTPSTTSSKKEKKKVEEQVEDLPFLYF